MNKLLENINEWVQNGPMGNDKQVVPQLLGAGVGILGSILGNKASSSVAPMDPDELKPYFSDARGTLGQMQGFQQEMAGYGRQLMDPGSQMNRQQQQMLRQRSMDQVALQNLLARRQAAATGQSSGVTAAQARMASSQAARDALGQFSQSMLQNRQQGLGVLGQSGGLLSNIYSGQMQQAENLAQAALAQRQQQMQAAQSRGDMWGGIMSGVGTSLMGLNKDWEIPSGGGVTINAGGN